jgi:Na+-driven multidrug efflux pump
VCGTIGTIFAVHPALWIGLLSYDAEVARIGALYLRIVGPVHLCFGLGLGLFYVTQGVGRPVAAMNANAVRMLASAAGGLVAIWWLDLGLAGFFAAVATGFCLYAALLVRAVTRVRAPAATLAATT